MIPIPSSLVRHPREEPLRLRAPLAAIGCVWLLVLFGTLASAGASPPPAVAPQTTVALMFASHSVLRAPRRGATVVTHIPVRQPITNERTALPVIGQATDSRGHRWLKVMLPGRPNGSSGWMREYMTRLTVTAWHLVIALRSRTVTVYLDGRRERSFKAVIGKPSTPTPTGSFFVQETVKMPRGDPGGPFALALSARSDVLQQFEGGPGQIAVHGRDELGGTLGFAESHGCVRVSDAAISWLARWVGPGVPVTIRDR